MGKSFSCAETAKLVRKALAESFPGIKFSVRSSVYAGGASIDVKWTDGPNDKQVNAVVHRFAGAYFDGMQDYKGYLHKMLDGEMVSFGADYIFTCREYSDKAVQHAIDAVYAKYIGNFEHDGIAKPTLEAFRAGELLGIQLSGLHGPWDYSRNVQQEIRALMVKSSDRLAVKESNLAARVIKLGNDGYSDIGALQAVAE